jgi:hypothetical protein
MCRRRIELKKREFGAGVAQIDFRRAAARCVFVGTGDKLNFNPFVR